MNLKNKKILITGSKGQLGSTIVNVFRQSNLNVFITDRSNLDITNILQVKEVLMKLKPDIIIHCAAYTSVDKAETEREECYRVNVDGTRNLALFAKELDIEFLYFSTDYVFDGSKEEPYYFSDKPNPINYYGLTKYLGEEIVRTLLSKYYIFRISWVFGPNGHNFINTIVRLANEKTQINIVSDQIGSPTYTIDIADLLCIPNDYDYGIHHLTNEGFISWYDFAKEIIKSSKLSCQVNPIISSQYITKAKRGLNSRLFQPKYFLRNWKMALKHYIKNNFDNKLT
jgi:dTDP-4-dehydrorhamnose reductase